MIDISICPVLSFKKAKALVGVLMTHDKSICVQVLEEQYDMMHKAKERQVSKVQATPHVSITIMDVEHTSEVEDTPEVEHTDIPMSPVDFPSLRFATPEMLDRFINSIHHDNNSHAHSLINKAVVTNTIIHPFFLLLYISSSINGLW
ncbi:predicted protein [Lichtheimia corymbifera JMRC:FSU:9682]|uniref:Uncharacterized protein n=1 Tax=Lichtheimia corymbifera JMRC:FSU:9682 TaxID=1263082 RepID=A0A068RFX4_9FUNG|nr:predicted protein [Lichtheimia corymbifera JMRC:FSU:9682]